jgi:hypothetical protein
VAELTDCKGPNVVNPGQKEGVEPSITLLSIFLLFVRFFSSVGSHEME